MRANHRAGRGISLLVGVMAATAAVAVEPALGPPERPAPWSLAMAGPGVAAMLAAAWLLGRRGPLRAGASAAVLAVLMIGPTALAASRYALADGGPLVEGELLAGLRNVVLALGAMGMAGLQGRLAALAALFLTLVAVSMADGPVATAAAGGFAAAGTAWLMADHWNRLPPRVRGSSRGAGRAWWAAPGVLLAAGGVAAGVAAVAPEGAVAVLAGLLPTSGGQESLDEDASSGVGDGPNEVEGRDDPKSIGYTQSEIYLDTDKPSLFDAFNDMYGEPRKKEQSDRAVAISADKIREDSERARENLKAGREFSNLRRPVRGRRPLADRDTEALLYVQGPAPAHLRLAAFDRLEGDSWIEAPEGRSLCPIVAEKPGGDWMRLGWPDLPFGAGLVSHKIKLARLDTKAVPAPALVERFRVGGVNQRDFFGWSQDQVLEIKARAIPASTVVETSSRTISPRELRRVDFPEGSSGAPADGLAGPAPGPVADLARAWAREAGKARGWAQVEALVARLRSHARHDRDAVAPEGCPDALAHFLLDARRGPDYLFAGSAALMLRSLGYPTRVVSGLYVRPDRYDARRRHTPVVREDVHFWAEVLTPSGLWVPVEPTPGYELLPPALSPLEKLAEGAMALAGWAGRNAWGLALAGVVVGAVGACRRSLADALEVAAWRLVAPRRTARGRVLAAVRLIDRRALRAGKGRPPGRPPTAWYAAVAADAPAGASGPMLDLLALADLALYGPPGADLARSLETCDRALRGWTIGRFREPGRPVRSPNFA